MVKKIEKPFISFGKGGRVKRFKTLTAAKTFAKGQSLLGRRGFVDVDKGKFTRSVIVFEPKKRRKK